MICMDRWWSSGIGLLLRDHGIKQGRGYALAELGESVPVHAQRALFGAFAGLFKTDEGA